MGTTWLSQVWALRRDLSKHAAQPTPSQPLWGKFTLSHFAGPGPRRWAPSPPPPALQLPIR